MIYINGAEKPELAGKSIDELLTSCGYRRELVAVEYNGEILPKPKYSETLLKDEDCVEVVSFVGGG